MVNQSCEISIFLHRANLLIQILPQENRFYKIKINLLILRGKAENYSFKQKCFKDKTSKQLVEFTPKLLHFTKLCGTPYFLPQPSNIFTQIYLSYLWHFATLWWTAIHWSSAQNWAWAYYHITKKRWGGWEEETQEGDGGGKAGFCNNKNRWQMLIRSFSDAYQILWKNFIIGFTCSKIGKTMGGRRVTVALFGMVIIWKPLLARSSFRYQDINIYRMCGTNNKPNTHFWW